ncbi:terminase-like family protein [Methanosphaera cuniculi]|nr:terminase-like family protein [Methanosphaera cuniculi]
MNTANEHGILGLGRWSMLINGGRWKPRDFDLIIIELLQYAIQGKMSKLLLSVPSRHGKSTLISKNFCSYFLSHFPNEQIILSSYSQRLASEFGGSVKDIINYYGYLSPYEVKVSSDNKAKNKFQIAKPYDGQMLAVGAGGSILGFGAGLFIIDDPIKSVNEAESETIQQRLRNWFSGTAKTRLQKRTDGKPPIMIVIAQRLHLKDLHGIIKETEPVISGLEALKILRGGESIDPNVWVDVNMPAICTDPESDILRRKKNEVLWEDQRSYDWLMKEKQAMGSYLFNAIYQGDPKEREGNIFKREWFYDELTDKLNCVIDENKICDIPTLRYWDFAGSGEQGDETSGVLTGYDGKNLYVLDLVNGKFTASQTKNKFIKSAYKDGKKTFIKIEQEPGSASKILINNLQRELQGYTIRADKVTRAKNMRSFELEALCEDRHFKIIKAPWNEKLVDQLINFTGREGGKDDIVDSLTGSARYWLKKKPKINV